MALLVSFLTLSITFVSRPIGAIVFGHYGDKIGRKKSLVLSLMIMGISTFFIGLIPSYDTIGNAAPLILIFCASARALPSAANGAGRRR